MAHCLDQPPPRPPRLGCDARAGGAVDLPGGVPLDGGLRPGGPGGRAHL